MTPTFQAIFAEQWDALAPALKAHYANRPFSRDRVTVEGWLDVEMHPLLRRLSGLIKLTGMLTPYEGKAVPVTVHFHSEPDSEAFVFERIFRFPGRAPVTFRSRMVSKRPHSVTEYMATGIGWRAHYHYEDGRVRLRHAGYAWRLFGIDLLLPVTWLAGRGDAWEEATGEDAFAMYMDLRHPWLGRLYSYGGAFRVTEIAHRDA